MFKKNYLFAISLLIPLVLYSQQSYAASESECGIWLCAPAGFPDGCSAPHSAMIKRIKKNKSIFPAISSCKDKKDQMPDDVISYDGKAAFIESHTKDGVRIPAHYVKNIKCINAGTSRDPWYKPAHCRYNAYYAEVFDMTNNKKIGKTYLIGGSGSSIPNYPVVTNNEYYSLYQSGSLNNLKKYVETINNDRQKGIDFDNEYREY